jgi:integrin beta 3
VPAGEARAAVPGARSAAGEQPAELDPDEEARLAEIEERIARTNGVRWLVLAGVVLALLVALPAVLLIRDSSTDPVFGSLDKLSLPAWAAVQHSDEAGGSSWCVKTCRLRERTWRSSKSAKDTAPVYAQALVAAGWQRVGNCPKLNSGTYTCWQHDQYGLDLWVRDAPCDLNNVAPAPGAAPATPAPSTGTGVGPGASGAAAPLPTPSGSEAPPTCAGSLVTAKSGNPADPNWHQATA